VAHSVLVEPTVQEPPLELELVELEVEELVLELVLDDVLEPVPVTVTLMLETV
jgi:hypothetical protein